MLKVIHSGDWHYNDRDHDEIEKCVDFMIDRARKEQADLIVVSGDITDSQNLKLDSKSAKTICRQFSEMADIAPVVNIIGTPSHDGKSAEILRYVRGEYPIHISEKPEQLYLTQGGHLVESPGLTDINYDEIAAVITQIPTPTKQFFQADSAIAEGDKAISDAMTALFGAFGVTAHDFKCPHILNGHFQVGGAFISETQQLIGRDIEISADQLAMANAHLICMGHIHLHQQIKKNIFYSGSIYRKTFGETEPKGFVIYNLSMNTPGVLYDGEFIHTPTRQKITVREDFTKSDIREVDAVLHSFGLEDLVDAYIKVEFKVWQDEANRINRAELERSFLDAGAVKADINLIRIPRETVRAARVLQLTKLRDKVQEMAVLRLEEVSDEILAKADLLETASQDELVQVVGRVN